MIRVLVVDDHPIVRQGLVSVLSDEDDLEVVGEAGSGREAVARVQRLQPDVVLLDLEMPDLDGVEAIPQLLALRPELGILVFTAYDTDERVLGAVRAGARGYLLKGADQEQIHTAIRAAANGEIIFGTQLAARMLAYFTAPAAAPAPVFPQLTERERKVLDLVAQGRANPAIAAKLSLSQKTVRNHVSNILTKLQVADRAQAIVQARDAGLGQQSRV